MKKWPIMIAMFLLLLVGCGGNNSSPLTGVASKAETGGRAIAVTINNHPLARPQSGLHKADVVYEILTEGDITRFLAIFQSERPDVVGPVRSARDYFIELAKGFNALYIAHGFSPEAEQMLQEEYVDNLNGMYYDGTLFKRSSSRVAPHNSYITYENILQGAKEKNYDMSQTPPPFLFMSEDETQKLTGNEANSVTITYSSSPDLNCTYEFDASLGKYKRFSGGTQTVDLETEEEILLDNIFIVEATHQVTDAKGRRDVDLQSGGRAYLLQLGKITEVEWENDNGRIIPVKDGEKIPFAQGKTWVNVVPTDPGLESSVSFTAD